MPGWMSHKLESKIAQRNNQQPQTYRRCHFNGRKCRGTKEPLDEGERRGWKAGLKLNIQKTEIMASCPITSWQEWEQWQILFSWAPKSLQTVAAAMKLKDAYSLEGQLWQT